MIKNNNLISIAKKLNKIWKKTYIIWWFSRALSDNQEYFWDIDLATDALPGEIEKALFVVKEVWKKYWTLIIKEWKETFEITTFREDIGILDWRKPVKVKFTQDLLLDSKRRDFSINSIYYDILKNEFVDPNNWVWDFKNKIIRFIWNPNDRIKEDALRILRFIRFKNEFSLKIAEKNYFEILKSNINLLKNISIERIKEEFEKILLNPNNINALKDLKKIWFFTLFFPEIDQLSKTPGWPRHHLEGNVWKHTILTIKVINNFFQNWFYAFDENIKKKKIFFNKEEKIILYYCLLFHDIWKYYTFSKDDKSHVHYYWHEDVWCEKFFEIKKRFPFSNKESKIISWLIENHLKLFKLTEMKKLKSRKLMIHPYFVYLLIVWFSDHLWRIPSTNDNIEKITDFYKKFLVFIKDKKFYTWNDIIKLYPELKWSQIKNKLEALNNQILAS